MKHLVKEVQKAVQDNKPVHIEVKTDGKLSAYKPITNLVQAIEKNKPTLYKGTWLKNLLSFEENQRCEIIALFASALINDVVIEGKLNQKVNDLGLSVLETEMKTQFWAKWYDKHLERFNKFFQDGTTDKYVKSVIYAMKKDGHTFKKFQ